MKSILLWATLIVTVFRLNVVYSEEVRSYKKISSSQAEVIIRTEEQGATQAAHYIDGNENHQFIQDLFKDTNSLLFKLKREIEKENCGELHPGKTGHIDNCGEVEITDLVMTSFGRGGWDTAGAVYTFFIGFRQDGTGRFFDVSHMVTLSESVQAHTTSDGDYNGVVAKELSLGRIVRIDEH